jgi:hypothetical protein
MLYYRNLHISVQVKYMSGQILLYSTAMHVIVYVIENT